MAQAIRQWARFAEKGLRGPNPEPVIVAAVERVWAAMWQTDGPTALRAAMVAAIERAAEWLSPSELGELRREAAEDAKQRPNRAPTPDEAVERRRRSAVLLAVQELRHDAPRLRARLESRAARAAVEAAVVACNNPRGRGNRAALSKQDALEALAKCLGIPWPKRDRKREKPAPW
jgi:hypothetical protein